MKSKNIPVKVKCLQRTTKIDKEELKMLQNEQELRNADEDEWIEMK